MRKIVHFIIDCLFVDATIDLFNSLENCENVYILIRNLPFQKKLYLKSQSIIECSRCTIKKYVQKASFADIIILHSLYSLPMDIIPLVNRSIKLCWFSWGYDIYENQPPLLPLVKINNIYGDRTLEISQLKNDSVITTKQKIRKKISEYLWPISKEMLESSINRIDFFSGVIPDEYDLLSTYSFFNARKILFSYPSSNDIFSYEKIDSDVLVTGINILIGNSATETNNHLDVFDLLVMMNLEGRQLVVPLSYGNQCYKDKVIEVGKTLFDDKFVPITDFLPLDDYKSLLNSCSVAIFAHERQQAVGNILISLWNGSKVYLSKNSVVYKYFASLGLYIYSIQDDFCDMSFSSLLSSNQIIENRKIISKHYSNEGIVNKIEKILEKI